MMNQADPIEFWLAKVMATEAVVKTVLSEVGTPAARVQKLGELLRILASAPIDVQEYFQESIVCLENNLYRSSIVVSWSGFFAVFCDSFVREKELEIRAKRPNWVFEDSLTLRDTALENHILQAAKDTGFLKKAEYRMLDGWLAQRNQCAHPTIYRPARDTAIGFVATMIDETITQLRKQQQA